MPGVHHQPPALGAKPIETLTPGAAPNQPTPPDAAKAVLGKRTDAPPPPAVASSDRMIAGAAGQIPARIYKPANASGALPVVVYFHGGGWVIADKNVYDGGARALAQTANAIVVSVDYRRAPEHKFPAAHEDALAAYRWVLANAASIGGDPKRVALAGESAGGNLAVATAIAARDAKLQQPTGVIAVYPVAQNDTTTASYDTYASAKPLNRPMIGWFLKNTLASPDQAQDPRLNLVAANLAGLPPVTIINAQIDPLLDDGAMLEAALKRANVSVERKVYDGVTHEFFGMGQVVDKAREAEQYAGERLKSTF
jgi:acetyl esterase/lipase